jgi:hypothetical protein
MKFEISDVCHAFRSSCVGTKVLDPVLFCTLLEQEVYEHNPHSDDEPGQHFIPLSADCLPLVSCGVGSRTDEPQDYVVRQWRGRCELFLRRERAVQATGVAAIVYTIDAYANDPEVDSDELARFVATGATHVIVAILAFGGPEGKPPVSPWRLVCNMAGGNNAALKAEASTLRSWAAKTRDYHTEWCVVAD